ncbi:hypothetical protein ACS2QQ_27320 [Bacillus cereus group sp. Bce032]|uniref:hypothetical protein n=1 Tax=Bacillus cereus group sp. Bce032 TaxID=3445236 RepID=UPI003F254D0C
MDSVRNTVICEVVWSIMRHNDQGYTEKNIGTETKIEDVFPSSSDEQKNRLGIALLEAWKSICLELKLFEIHIGYEPRKEHEIFEKMEDIMDYFTNLATLNLIEEDE